MHTENKPTTWGVYLETSDDWGIWDHIFKLKAHAAQIWNLINPDTSDQPMQPPVRPPISSYYQRIPPQRLEPERPRQTRRSDGQGPTQTLQTPVPTHTPETTSPTQQARHFSELTAEDRVCFQFEREEYGRDCEKFERELCRIVKMKDWVMDTVATGLMATALEPEQDLRSWYISLRDIVGTTTTEQQNQAQIEYQKILSTVPTAAKEFPRWLLDWEQATRQAQAKGTGGLDNPNVWFKDLCDAIQPVLGTWVSIYREIYHDKLESKSLSVRDAVKTLRLKVSRQGFQQSAKKTNTAWVTGGTSSPTFENDADAADQPDPDQVDQSQAGSSGSKRSRKKRKYSQLESTSKKPNTKRAHAKDSSSCDAYEGNHKLSTCYYVFPSKAPWFKGDPTIRDAVRHRLVQYRPLIDKVTALKESARPTESD
ncbi:hypothetical protein G7Z17_g8019 [Cylindrodendrum hubeiense]|uniref:Gag protein n=1 Tax=Cylindrodendrum hubeiense TaxID=595255 RepID=A0A9P5H9D3_9HYPO|nr:hypothetical protein G7Z17_g8019 [Cylindrodendrum hubeiense]